MGLEANISSTRQVKLHILLLLKCRPTLGPPVGCCRDRRLESNKVPDKAKGRDTREPPHRTWRIPKTTSSARSMVFSKHLHTVQCRDQHFGCTEMSQLTEKSRIRSVNNRRC